MKPCDIALNDIWLSESGWLRESIYISVPQPQFETVIVPGRSSPVRFATNSFEPRTIEAVLTMLGKRSRFDIMVASFMNAYLGKTARIKDSEWPYFYYVGTIQAEAEYDPLSGKGVLKIIAEDCDAYRYASEETSISITGSGTVYLSNGYMPVVPTITLTASTMLSWTKGGDSFSKTLSAGTWQIPELELEEGNNTVTVSGSGRTTFRYREGQL